LLLFDVEKGFVLLEEDRSSGCLFNRHPKAAIKLLIFVKCNNLYALMRMDSQEAIMIPITSNKKWSVESRMQIIMQLINRQTTYANAIAQHNISRANIKSWIHQLVGDSKLQPDVQSILYKDLNFRYQGCNVIGGEVGTKCKTRNAMGKTDFDITPEMARDYQSFDEVVFSTAQPFKVTSKVYLPILGAVQGDGTLYPVKNDHGDAVGTLIVVEHKLKLREITFSKIYQILQSGYANCLLTQLSYQVNYLQKKIHFSCNEALIYLYLLIGKSVKEIAKFTNKSPRTIENIIMTMKNKLGCNTITQLVDILWNYKLLPF
jgi:DNA-binding CsgD family transcriptional regulator